MTWVLDPLSAPALIKSFSDQTVLVNSLVLLDCEASGNPSPVITWLKDGQPLVFAPPRVEYLSNQGKLRISSVTVNDEGRYTCSATNVKGSVTVFANLTVQGEFLLNIFGLFNFYALSSSRYYV